MKLVSMVDWVLEYDDQDASWDAYEAMEYNIRYANFLNRPLKLGMFVPCDEEGNVLDFIEYESYVGSDEDYNQYIKKYHRAEERVLFEGFEYLRWYKGSHIIILIHNGEEIFDYNANQGRFIISANKIEHLVKYNLELTENAIKQLTQ